MQELGDEDRASLRSRVVSWLVYVVYPPSPPGRLGPLAAYKQSPVTSSGCFSTHTCFGDLRHSHCYV